MGATSTLATVVQTPTTPAISATFLNDANLWSVVDPDIAHENPVEDKHRRLVRSHRSSPYDRDLKPNAKNRDELAVCIHNSMLPFWIECLSLADPQLPSWSTPDVRREGSYLEIPFLSCKGQERSY